MNILNGRRIVFDEWRRKVGADPCAEIPNGLHVLVPTQHGGGAL